MNSRYKGVLYVGATLLALAGGLAYWSKPHTYEDCVLHYVSKASSPLAANLMRKACDDKFAEAKPTEGPWTKYAATNQAQGTSSQTAAGMTEPAIPPGFEVESEATGAFDDLIPAPAEEPAWVRKYATPNEPHEAHRNAPTDSTDSSGPSDLASRISLLGQWAVLVAPLLLLPIAYRRIWRSARITWLLRLTTYAGTFIAGAVIATLLVGAGVISVHWVAFVLLLAVLMNRYTILYLAARGADKPVGQPDG